MRQIIVNSKTHGSKTILVDDEDFVLLSKFRWYVFKTPVTFYAEATVSFKTRARMHRFILMLKEGEVGDHIDGNGLNNQRSNLRKCTQHQNLMNMRKPSHNTTGFKGVVKVRNRFYAQMSLNNKHVFLGSYKTAIEAAEAYNKAALKHRGEFAKLNDLSCAV